MGTLKSQVAIAIRIKPKGQPAIWLTTVDDNSISASSTVTEYPIVDGSMVADHMYKEPITYAINGAFGYNDVDNYKEKTNNSLLSSFQTTFENLKNSGTLCDIVKITTKENGPQFLKRTNMILQSLTWTEGTNSLSYSFNFRQVLSAEVGIQEVDTQDIYLPQIDELKMLNFTDTIVDWDLIDAIVLNTAVQEELIDAKLLDWMAKQGNALLAGIGVAAGITVVVAAWNVAKIAIGLASGITGLLGVILLGGFAIFMMGRAIVNAFKNQKQYARLQFKYYEDDAKNREEAIKVGHFMSEIHRQLMMLNNAIHVYQVPSNEPCEAIVGIEDMYYIFNFSKRLNNVGWKVSARDINGVVKCSDYPLATNPKSAIPPQGAELR